MASSSSSATTRASQRILHPGSAAMLVGGLLLIVGAVTPWVSTPLGNLSGMVGPGLWVLCAGTIAMAGALLPYRRVALAHALVAALAAGGLALWQVVRIVHLSATTDSWGTMLPGIGLVLAAGGAGVLLRAAYRIRSAA
ncbi:hypothetical protein F4561_002264 [Lipingzhangella halophila]|uniref:Uncharacterized protein n=1 Tax=Lipingzhangella halophila TaxID=1783352 RepID=A0A7W7RGC4_9ACTN|nr:hypothetical protein [Lipingzhangella halophila]MBB4931444.1 hypothetical protein [Lipingzhangella halophila]